LSHEVQKQEAHLARTQLNDGTETITGVVRSITFRNDETGFTIAKIELEKKAQVVAVKGKVASLVVGESALFRGEWITDPKYGRQFLFESCEPVQPASVEGIRRFLASANIKGIGEALSRRIVEKYGEQTIDILDNHPEKLRKVKGITPKLVESIKEGWAEHRHIRDIMIFLQSYEISPAYATRIYNNYRGDTISRLRDNPYRLIADIRGIGFIKADQIAANLGIDRNAPTRIRAGIIYCLDAASDEGHVYLTETVLVELAAKTLDLDTADVMTVLGDMKNSGKVSFEDDRIYRSDLAGAERELAILLAAIARTRAQTAAITPEAAGELLAMMERDRGISFAPLQQKAIVTAVTTACMVITGGPGTGKTTTVLGIIDLYTRQRRHILLCAPTGRAAKRMTEATGREAMTIHRLLEYDPFHGVFKRNADNPLEADVVIMDEASMVDTCLMRDFLLAIEPSTTLVIVGDVDQLPSIGPGSVLRDIIASDAIPTVRLTEIFRQAAASRIVESAHLINQGRLPKVDNHHGGNFFFMRMTDPARIAETIVDLATRRLPERYGFDPSADIQVLSPMHRGETGVANLNRLIQERLNPFDAAKPEIRRGDLCYRPGDKVMQIRNNYDKMVYNGDIGWVTTIDPAGRKLGVRFDRPAEYTFDELDEIVPAYAISVHKSQGSEFRCVIMPVTTQHYIMLKRNLLYTGITRAKELAVILGDYKALAIAVQNDQAGERNTSLAARLRDTIEQ
jgi:exodeoxyribonuclease V alpha subunit